MKRILLTFLILLVACNKTSDSNLYYNMNHDYFIFDWDDKIVFNVVGSTSEWLVYDPSNETLLPLSVKVTDKLKNNGQGNNSSVSAFPHQEGIYLLEEVENLNGKKWIIDDIPSNSIVPHRIVDSQKISLIDDYTMTNIIRISDDIKWNIFSPMSETLDNSGINNIIPYNNSVFQVTDYGIIRTDFYGNNKEYLPVKLTGSRQDISFINYDIYYLDTFYNVRKYNTSTKEDELIIENVFEFYIDEQGIFYTSLKDFNFYQYNSKSKQNILLLESNSSNSDMRTDMEYVYYLSGASGLDLYRTSIIDKNSELVYENCARYYLLEDKVFVVNFDGEINLINK